jgi:phosphate transport system protein
MAPRSVFDRKLQELRDDVLRMGSMADTAIGCAMQVLVERDAMLARQIISGDEKINTMRFNVEKHCLKLIACQQPAAHDLRFILAVMNIVLELERIADHAVGIASSFLRMKDQPFLKPLIDLPRMGEVSQEMLRASLDAFIYEDTAQALQVAQRDQEVNQLYQQIFCELLSFMMRDPSTVTGAMYLSFCAHKVERIADRVTNICEQVVFAATGRMEEMPSEAVIK